MPNTSLLGILSLKLIFSFGFLNTANANESFDICEIKTNYRTYTNKSRSRSSYTGAVTQSGEMTCRQIDRNTYQITIDGRARYIHRSAVISTRPQSLAVERSLRPLPRPRVTESAPAVALPTSLNEPLRSNSGEIAAQPSGLTIQNGIIGSSETPAYHVTISTKNAPEIPSGAADATLAPEAQRLTEPTRLLESAGWVTPRSEPNRDSRFACSVVVDGSCSTGRTQVGTIDHNVVLIPTGERTYDSDHREWYFKASFDHAGQSYEAWFAEKQTEIDPHEALVREQTAQRVQAWLNGAPGSIYGSDEVASDEPYQLSMTPEDITARSLATGFDPNASYDVYGSDTREAGSMNPSNFNECFIERGNYYSRRGGATISDRDGSYSKAPGTSTGYCYRYVKLILLDCGAVDGYLNGVFAKNAGPSLTAAGYTKLDTLNPHEAPVGSVIVYDNKCNSTHRAGHIEIKTAENSYVSDFISSSPASDLRPTCRPVKGIYIR